MVAKKKAKVSKPKLTEITMWTRRYRPFIMGGDVNRGAKTRVMATGPYPIGKGFEAYVVVSPRGTMRVVEAKSGGIVGDTLESVRVDIALCPDKAFMTAQCNESLLLREKAELIPIEEFWGAYEKCKR